MCLHVPLARSDTVLECSICVCVLRVRLLCGTWLHSKRSFPRQVKRARVVPAPSSSGVTVVCASPWSQEFHNGKWMKEQKAKLAPNILAFSRQFNHVSLEGLPRSICSLCLMWCTCVREGSVFLHVHKGTHAQTCTYIHHMGEIHVCVYLRVAKGCSMGMICSNLYPLVNNRFIHWTSTYIIIFIFIYYTK